MHSTLADLDDAIKLCRQAANFIRVQKYDWRHFFIAALYHSILEFADSASAIIRSSQGSHAYLILRSLLEAYADLTNLTRHKTYHKCLILEGEKHYQAVLVSAKKGNLYMKSMAESLDLVEEMSRRGRLMKQMKKEGARILETKEKFRRAGLADLYEGPYRYLNSHVHNGLNGLITRHVRVEIDRDDFKLVAFERSTEQEMDVIISQTKETLLHGSIIAHEFFDTGEEDAIRRKFEDMKHKFAQTNAEQTSAPHLSIKPLTN